MSQETDRQVIQVDERDDDRQDGAERRRMSSTELCCISRK